MLLLQFEKENATEIIFVTSVCLGKWGKKVQGVWYVTGTPLDSKIDLVF